MASRKHNLKHRYGITEEDYNQMAEKQKHCCQICNNKPVKPLYVNHCHSTNKIRGLLCHKCNVALGHMNDDPKQLLKAVEYITKYQSCQ